MEEEGSLPVAAWLAALHLEQYVECFQRRELWTVRDCRALTEQSLTQLGVRLPGHRRRILLGLQKAFAEGTPPMAPAPKPVPMKRHVFRMSTATVPEQPEQPAHPEEHPEPRCPPMELDKGAPFTHHPPPIPPRVGCRPPVKFSASLKGGSPEPPHSPPTAPGAPNPNPPPATTKPPLRPPLPAKRHQLEAKGQAPQAPPELPPRTASHRRSWQGAGSAEARGTRHTPFGEAANRSPGGFRSSPVPPAAPAAPMATSGHQWPPLAPVAPARRWPGPVQEVSVAQEVPGGDESSGPAAPPDRAAAGPRGSPRYRVPAVSAG
ncbi:arf-GAP with Rho-GAP domain, ANK repeat and PH domain-containing protein 1-like [Strigops habroptila]|uniref:arf-GAP with Rho-GAP domain, ANK repeat and PH domain-containing protein 1-like n=1 Tax=Strigops habroptila TaxID=2489341 RepID=UPI0011CFD164|nr:arf-GAP with Rho-GAP domain, ANK repeat and PH domain-containing protein 1-like [Strigops habroptila]